MMKRLKKGCLLVLGSTVLRTIVSCPCFSFHEEGARGGRGGLLLDLTRAADSISLHCNISARQPSKQGRWGVAGWVHGPHIEWSLSFITAGGGLRTLGQHGGDRVNVLKRKGGSNIEDLQWLRGKNQVTYSTKLQLQKTNAIL